MRLRYSAGSSHFARPRSRRLCADRGEEMLLSNSIRTFLCPSCGAVITTGIANCDVCSAPIDAQVAEAAAERRELVLRANGEASNLVIGARMILPFFGLSFVPFLSPWQSGLQSLSQRQFAFFWYI